MIQFLAFALSSLTITLSTSEPWALSKEIPALLPLRQSLVLPLLHSSSGHPFYVYFLPLFYLLFYWHRLGEGLPPSRKKVAANLHDWN